MSVSALPLAAVRGFVRFVAWRAHRACGMHRISCCALTYCLVSRCFCTFLLCLLVRFATFVVYASSLASPYRRAACAVWTTMAVGRDITMARHGCLWLREDGHPLRYLPTFPLPSAAHCLCLYTYPTAAHLPPSLPVHPFCCLPLPPLPIHTYYVCTVSGLAVPSWGLCGRRPTLSLRRAAAPRTAAVRRLPPACGRRFGLSDCRFTWDAAMAGEGVLSHACRSAWCAALYRAIVPSASLHACGCDWTRRTRQNVGSLSGFLLLYGETWVLRAGLGGALLRFTRACLLRTLYRQQSAAW